MRLLHKVNAVVVAAATIDHASTFQLAVAKGSVNRATFSTLAPGIGISPSQFAARTTVPTTPDRRAGLFVSVLERNRTRARHVKCTVVQHSTSGTTSSVPAPVVTTKKAVKPKASTLRVAFYLLVWYSLTIGYNIYNKATLNRINIPWILSTVQLAIGGTYVSLIWALGIRKAPRLTASNIRSVAPLAALHTTAHIAAVIGLSAGAIGFVQIVKAAEPLFTALFSALFLGQIFPLPVYAALVPVVGGVAVASAKELSFTWLGFGGAMASNIAAASRGVLAKASMDAPKGENMDAGNLYGVMTIMATIFLAPFAVFVEGRQFKGLYDAAIAAGHTRAALLKGTFLSGIFFYMYNEVAFYCLNAIHPVTHAVANTLKRVFLIAVSIIVFGHKLTPLGSVGSAVAISGVLLYSLTKQKLSKK